MQFIGINGAKRLRFFIDSSFILDIKIQLIKKLVTNYNNNKGENMKKTLMVALATIGLAGAAQATPTGQMNFSGLVTTNCTFTNVAAGTLSARGTGSEYLLESGAPGSGLSASFDLAYGGAPTVSIDAVTAFSVAPQNLPTLTSLTTGLFFNNPDNDLLASAAGAHSFSTGSKSFALDPGVTQDVGSVVLSASAATAFPVGDYHAETTITCQ